MPKNDYSCRRCKGGVLYRDADGLSCLQCGHVVNHLNRADIVDLPAPDTKPDIPDERLHVKIVEPRNERERIKANAIRDRAVAALKSHGHDADEIAQILGVGRSEVYDSMLVGRMTQIIPMEEKYRQSAALSLQKAIGLLVTKNVAYKTIEAEIGVSQRHIVEMVKRERIRTRKSFHGRSAG